MLLNIDGHCIDDEFIELIKKEYDVEIIGSIENPWNIVFKGSKKNLIKMYKDHWNQDFDNEVDSLDDWLTEE